MSKPIFIIALVTCCLLSSSKPTEEYRLVLGERFSDQGSLQVYPNSNLRTDFSSTEIEKPSTKQSISKGRIEIGDQRSSTRKVKKIN